MQGAVARDGIDELTKAQLARFNEKAGERNQDQQRQPRQGQAHGQTKPRQRAPLRSPAHIVP